MPNLPAMSNNVAWLGWLATVGSCGIAVWQAIRELRRRAAREAHDSHLRATLDQLRYIRAQFAEALQLGEVFKTEGDKAVIRATAHNLLGAENHMRLALGISPEEELPLAGSRRGPAPPHPASSKPVPG
jgi:hypothetical protein